MHSFLLLRWLLTMFMSLLWKLWQQHIVMYLFSSLIRIVYGDISVIIMISEFTKRHNCFEKLTAMFQAFDTSTFIVMLSCIQINLTKSNQEA